MIREPIVAGAFYPAEKRELETKIENFFKKAQSSKPIPGNLKILIVPHAGYDYSGQTAAFGYHQVKDKDVKNIILIGPTHQVYFSGAASTEADSWQTPLGTVKVSQPLRSKLSFNLNSQAHKHEHSLEVQLPFLQTFLKNFSIYPLLLGEGVNKDWQEIASRLSKVIDEKTLVVISSDLSHYPEAAVTEKVDKRVTDSILTGKVAEFQKAIKQEMGKGYPQLHTCACGEQGIITALFLAKKLNIKKIKLLKYTHSGQITGDHSRVVGYASIGFFK